MTTLPIRAPHLPQVWPLPSLARFVALVSLFIDAYAEALQQTHEARRKYPFADV
jgi:hypothetical protein